MPVIFVAIVTIATTYNGAMAVARIVTREPGWAALHVVGAICGIAALYLALQPGGILS